MWVTFRPDLDELGVLQVAGPSLNTSDFHELSSFAFPRQFSVGDLCVNTIDWTDICGCYEHDVLLLDVVIIPYAFRLALDSVLHVQAGRVDHHFGSIFVELEELLDGFRVHEIISDNNFTEKILQTLATGVKILFCHLEEEAFFGELRQGVVGGAQSLEKVVELREPLFDVPLVISGFELYVEEDCSLFGWIF